MHSSVLVGLTMNGCMADEQVRLPAIDIPDGPFRAIQLSVQIAALTVLCYVGTHYVSKDDFERALVSIQTEAKEGRKSIEVLSDAIAKREFLNEKVASDSLKLESIEVRVRALEILTASRNGNGNSKP